MIDEDMLEDIISSEDDIKIIGERLIKMANDLDGTDNITIILVQEV